jgi:hypothetical protein
MGDEIVVPLKWLSTAVTLKSYENEQARQIVENELKRRIDEMGTKFHNVEWHTYLGEEFANCFVTYYEVSDG